MSKIIYSFIVDAHPKFAYQGWLLARSLCAFCDAAPSEINVQVTAEVPVDVRQIFANEGYVVHQLARFGDGRWCNKLSQLPNLATQDCDYIVLLDTDTIAVSDLRDFFHGQFVHAKVVDFPNPSLAALRDIFAAAGLAPPDRMKVDASHHETYIGNSNGGLYAVPRPLVGIFSEEWRTWAIWLLENPRILQREGKLMHVDQVAAALALRSASIPFKAAPSNVNYFVHFAGEHRHFDRTKPIALLHYHDVSMNVVGLIEPPVPLDERATAAVNAANNFISSSFQNTLFWNFRYAAFPDRGSGLGSRGRNMDLKRSLLRREGIERSRSILDVGCGDLEVLHDLKLNGYLGIDVSIQAINIARSKRPDLQFELIAERPFEPRDLVICLEVLIHQTSFDAYRALIDFLAAQTRQTLIVSGYDRKLPHHMCYFFEPLVDSLVKTGAFSSIRKIGEHTDVVVYRCDRTTVPAPKRILHYLRLDSMLRRFDVSRSPRR